MSERVMDRQTFESFRDMEGVDVVGTDVDRFEDYEEYLAYHQARQAQRTADAIAGTVRSAEFVVDVVAVTLLLVVLWEGSDVVARKLRRGY